MPSHTELHMNIFCGTNNRKATLIIHSFIQTISIAPLQVHYYSEAQRHFRHSTDTVSEFRAEAPQATVSEGLAQGPYVAASAGLEPMTLQTKCDKSTNEPPCPAVIMLEIKIEKPCDTRWKLNICFRVSIVHYHLDKGGLGGVVVIDAAFGAHGKSRPRFKPGTLLLRCSDLGQVVNLSLSVA